MDKNHQDTTESKRMITKDKSQLPLLSQKDQEIAQKEEKRSQKELAHLRKRLRKNRNKAKHPLLVVAMSVTLVGVIVLIYLWFRFSWPWWILILIGILLLIPALYTIPWAGFRDKKLWDWLNLLGVLAVPLLLGIATLLFTAQQAQGALDQQRADTLQTYLADMSDLLLNHHLSTSKPGDIVSDLARARTLTTLRRLDANRNRTVLQFLREAHLIGLQNTVITLSNADLSTDDLSGVDLSDISLSGDTLGGTNLSGADLSGADLSGAILGGADLYGADLSDALLRMASLNGATLNGALLSDADLSGADLSGATLNGATLSDAGLYGADLSGATLNGAHLSEANLSGVDLKGADLSGANLSDADLYEVRYLSQQQLDQVSSCTNADLRFTGLKCYLSGSIVTLTYWYTEGTAETPVILQRIKQFEQQNPNIKINAVYEPFSQTQAAFINASQAGNAPDVLRSDIGWVTQFASRYYLLDIDSHVSQNDLSDYLKTSLSYDKYNGHLYGLPQVTDFLALLYNKAELAKVGITSPPKTIADFEVAAKKIVQSNAATYGFETTGTSYHMLPFLWAFGGGMIDQHNQILVNNSGSVAGLTFLLQLQNADRVMPAQVDFSNGYNNMVNDFMSGKTAMIFDGPWDLSYILNNGSAFTRNTNNLGIAAVPMGPSSDQPRSPTGGQSYVISTDTAHPAEAYKFISFMSSTTSQVAIATANHTLPTRLSAYQDLGISGDRFISAFHAIQKTAIARPAIPQGGHLFDAFDPNIEAALDGAKSATDALNAVADAWKQLLASS